MSNYTMPTNVTNWPDLLGFANMTVNYWFGNTILIMIFVIAFTYFSNYPGPRAFTMAGFMTTLLGVFMFWMGLISSNVLIICLVITVGGLIMTKVNE